MQVAGEQLTFVYVSHGEWGNGMDEVFCTYLVVLFYDSNKQKSKLKNIKERGEFSKR